MLRLMKREEMLRERRLYKGREGMARVIAVVPLSGSVELGRGVPLDLTPVEGGRAKYYSAGNKQNLEFLFCARDVASQAAWLMRVLEAVQVADCVLFVAHTSDQDIDLPGQDALAVIRGVGVSSAAAIVQNVASTAEKDRWLRILQAECSTISRVYAFASDDSCVGPQGQSQDRLVSEFERLLCEQHLNGISWRDVRPFLVAEAVEVSEDGKLLKITGFGRGGRPFSANRLVHLPALGETFVVRRIETVPAGMTVHEQSIDDAETLDAEWQDETFVAEATASAVETMMADGDVAEHDVEMVPKRPGKLVPKGTSAYQATWLDDVDPAEVEEDGEEYEFIPESGEDDKEEEEEDDSQGAMRVDFEEHDTQLAAHKQRLEIDDRHFPDEVHLDPHVAARTRLQKYRGVASLRTSTWDPNEGLPAEYRRIFRFANFRQSRKAALEGAEEDNPLSVGQRICLFVDISSSSSRSSKDIAAVLSSQRSPLVVFGLLKYEQRQTVVNFSFARAKAFAGTLENKEELLAVLGFRRFIINPVFSEHSNANLHKMLRRVDASLLQNGLVVGTVYAPVTFSPAPVLLFRPRAGTPDELELVGVGSVMDVDTQRIILKRITLTGSPFKIHKRSAVVRFMFANAADIAWFRPVELTTRLGARGHIRESLGTHGYMKCLFDRNIFHHDTVAMHLYKRVFPKWSTRPFV